MWVCVLTAFITQNFSPRTGGEMGAFRWPGGLLPHRGGAAGRPALPSGTTGLSVTAALLSVMRRTDGLLRRGESLSSPPGTTLTIEDNGAVLTMRTEELPTPLFKRRRLPGGEPPSR